MHPELEPASELTWRSSQVETGEGTRATGPAVAVHGEHGDPTSVKEALRSLTPVHQEEDV